MAVKKLPYKNLAGVTTCPGGWLVLPARMAGVTVAAEDAFVVNLGAEIPIGGPWLLRGGLVWDGAPEKEEYRTLVDHGFQVAVGNIRKCFLFHGCFFMGIPSSAGTTVCCCGISGDCCKGSDCDDFE